MKKYKPRDYSYMNHLFSKRSQSLPEKNIHLDESPRGRSPRRILTKLCQSMWEKIVQTAILKDIGKRSASLIKEQNIQDAMMKQSAWEIHTISLDDIDLTEAVAAMSFGPLRDSGSLGEDGDVDMGDVESVPAGIRTGGEAIHGCEYIYENSKWGAHVLKGRFYCIDKLQILLSFPYIQTLSIFNLPFTPRWYNESDAPKLSRARSLWGGEHLMREGNLQSVDPVGIIKELCLIDQHHFGTDAGDGADCVEFYEELRRLWSLRDSHQLEHHEGTNGTSCAHSLAEPQCSQYLKQCHNVTLTRLLLKDLEMQLRTQKVVFFVNRITKEKTWKYIPGANHLLEASSMVSPPDIGEIISLEMPYADWKYPIREDDPIFKTRIADLYVRDVASAVQTLQEKSSVLRQENVHLKKGMARLQEVEKRSIRLEKRFNTLERLLMMKMPLEKK